MLAKLTLQRLREFCDLSKYVEHTSECLTLLDNGVYAFHKGVVLPYDHVLSTYKLRYRIAQEIRPDKLGWLADFKRLMNSLELSKAEEIGIATVSQKNITYIIFYQEDGILSVLKGEKDFEL